MFVKCLFLSLSLLRIFHERAMRRTQKNQVGLDFSQKFVCASYKLSDTKKLLMNSYIKSQIFINEKINLK